jgi:hypothetical protein
VQDTARLGKGREIIFSQFAGAWFIWIERLPVTQEVAGSSPVAPAIFTMVRYKLSPMCRVAQMGHSDGTLGQAARPVNTRAFVITNPVKQERLASLVQKLGMR